LNNKDNGSISEEKGNAFIVGIRPSRIFGLECDDEGERCIEKLILDCSKVEGGLQDEDEDQE
jgi:hypothetical protein